MSMSDFFRLMKRYIALIILVPVLFMALSAAYAHFENKKSVYYTANAFVVTGNGGQLANLTGAATTIARDYAGKNPGYSASVKSDGATLTVTISAKGPDSEGTIKAANSIASATADGAKALLGKDAAISANVIKATGSASAGGRSLVIYIVAALISGLFVAVCVILAIDAIRRPVKSKTDLANASKLPVIGELPNDPADRLLANVRFASNGNVNDVLILPMRKGDAAALVSMILERAASSEPFGEKEKLGGDLHVTVCDPLLQDIGAAYRAREASATIIACAQWSDSRKDVESTASELQLAGANVIGCVLVGSKFLKKNRGLVQ